MPPLSEAPFGVEVPLLPVIEEAKSKLVVRHAPVDGNERVEGSVRQLLWENVSLAGGSVITSDLLVPGTPTVQITGNPAFWCHN